MPKRLITVKKLRRIIKAITMKRYFVALLLGLSLSNAHAVKQGDALPACVLDALLDKNQHFDLQALRGKVMYVDFWASWCAPCAKSFPFLNALQEKYADKGLQVLAINMDEQPAASLDFLKQHPAQFSLASDLLGQCAENFAVEAMPSSYIVDKKGIVRHVHVGFRPDEAEPLHGLLEKLLAEKSVR